MNYVGSDSLFFSSWIKFFSELTASSLGSMREHIWSPPVLQDRVNILTGTGLRPYIRPVSEELYLLASMRSARIVLITLPAFDSRSILQVFNTPVLPVVSSCLRYLRNRERDALSFSVSQLS